MSKRKSPKDIVESIMEALRSEPQTIQSVAKSIESSWVTAWKYLSLIHYIQSCPKVDRMKVGKRIELWRREWGRLPS